MLWLGIVFIEDLGQLQNDVCVCVCMCMCVCVFACITVRVFAIVFWCNVPKYSF